MAIDVCLICIIVFFPATTSLLFESAGDHTAPAIDIKNGRNMDQNTPIFVRRTLRGRNSGAEDDLSRALIKPAEATTEIGMSDLSSQNSNGSTFVRSLHANKYVFDYSADVQHHAVSWTGEIVEIAEFDPQLSNCRQFSEFFLNRIPLLVSSLMGTLASMVLKIPTKEEEALPFWLSGGVNLATAPIILTGTSGAGKTTTILYLIHQAQQNGTIVLNIDGKDFCDASFLEAQADCIRNFLQWNKAESLSSINIEAAPQSLSSFLSAVDYKQDDTVLPQVIGALEQSNVPVLITVNQVNLIIECNITQLTKLRLITNMWRGEPVSNKVSVIYALSSSYDVNAAMTSVMDTFIRVVLPMKKEDFYVFAGTLVIRRILHPICMEHFNSLYDHCGGLPREAVSFARFLGTSTVKDADFYDALNEHKKARAAVYLNRISRAFDNKLPLAVVRESYIFAARYHLTRTISTVPRYWLKAGLLASTGTELRFACPAVEMAFMEWAGKHFYGNLLSFCRSLRATASATMASMVNQLPIPQSWKVNLLLSQTG